MTQSQQFACPDIEAAVERVTRDVAVIGGFSPNIATVFDNPENGRRYINALAADLTAILSERKALREALGELFALVKGECPRLLNEDSGGNAVLALKIEAALKGDADVSR